MTDDFESKSADEILKDLDEGAQAILDEARSASTETEGRKYVIGKNIDYDLVDLMPRSCEPTDLDELKYIIYARQLITFSDGTVIPRRWQCVCHSLPGKTLLSADFSQGELNEFIQKYAEPENETWQFRVVRQLTKVLPMPGDLEKFKSQEFWEIVLDEGDARGDDKMWHVRWSYRMPKGYLYVGHYPGTPSGQACAQSQADRMNREKECPSIYAAKAFEAKHHA